MHVKQTRAAVLIGALAWAGVAVAASSVSLYGVVDTGAAHTRYTYRHAGVQARYSHNGMRSGYLSSNRIGLKGDEDLGGGVSAVFRFESEVDLNDGSTKTSFWNRYAYVGMKGDGLGTITMGRQKDVADMFTDMDQVRGLGRIKRAFGGHGARRDGLINYVTPDFAGFRAGVSWAHNQGVTRNHVSAGLHYMQGPLEAAAVYGRDKLYARDDAIQDWMVIGAWDFRVVRVQAAYGQDRNGKFNTPGDIKADAFGADAALMESVGVGQYGRTGFKSKNYYLGADAPLGPGHLGVAYTRSTSNLGRLGFSGKSQDLVAAMYVYKLSKRTHLYGYGGWGQGVGYVNGLKAQEFGIGMRHKF